MDDRLVAIAPAGRVPVREVLDRDREPFDRLRGSPIVGVLLEHLGLPGPRRAALAGEAGDLRPARDQAIVRRGLGLRFFRPVAAAMNPRDAKARRAQPLLDVAGESDRVVRFAVQARTIERVRSLNGCDPAGRPAGEWCLEYPSPKRRPVVTFIHPGGHAIPAGAPARIVAFFKRETGR